MNHVEQILQPIGAAYTGTHFASIIRVYLPPWTQADLMADVLVAKARRSIALLVNVMCDIDRFYIVIGGVLDISLGGEVRRGPSYPDLV